eukprot:7886229-Alexandrium_andersonii.AAC.1
MDLTAAHLGFAPAGGLRRRSEYGAAKTASSGARAGCRYALHAQAAPKPCSTLLCQASSLWGLHNSPAQRPHPAQRSPWSWSCARGWCCAARARSCGAHGLRWRCCAHG